MKTFRVKNGNFMKSAINTSYMINSILMILSFFLVYRIFREGIYPVMAQGEDIRLVFRVLIFVITPAIIGTITEYLYYLARGDKKSFDYLVRDNYALLPGAFLGSLISLNVPLLILVLGSIVSSIVKVLMGDIGKCIFNPTIIGYLVIMVTYTLVMKKDMALINFDIPLGISILAFIYLLCMRIIKWRITICYIGSVLLISFILCMIGNISFDFMLFNLLAGNLLFGSILLATDPITSPYTNVGQIIGGMFLGIVTMVIRYLTFLDGEVMVAILLFNLFTLFINYLTIWLYGKKIIRYLLVLIMFMMVIGSSYLISIFSIAKL